MKNIKALLSGKFNFYLRDEVLRRVCGEKWAQFPSGGSKERDIKREKANTQTIK